MSRSNLVIANKSFPATRTDLNLALLALGSLSSSSYAPTPPYANMLWYDTSANILKMRSEANDVWISVGYLDQSSNAFRIFDDTQVVSTSGTQTGLLGDQATSVWELGTATLQSLVSPANVKAAILALAPAPAPPIGVSQSWASSPAVRASVYQNVGGRPLQVSASLRVTSTSNQSGNFFGTASFQVSSNNSTWITLGSATATGLGSVGNLAFTPIIPHAHYYRWTGSESGGYSGTLAFADFAILQ